MKRRARQRTWKTLAKVQELEGLALRATENAKKLQAEQIEERIRELGVRLDSVSVGSEVNVDVLIAASAEAAERRRASEDALERLRMIREEARQLEERARETSRGALTYQRLCDRR
jgi:hypothetical protein